MDKKVQKLLSKKGVVSVGYGRKVTKGVETKVPALVVGVAKKLPKSAVNKRDLVPETVDGWKTDVIETGDIHALYANPTEKYRPCPAGVSVGHYQITAGTLGAWVNKGSYKYILSNNHVLANVNEADPGDPILQPGSYDNGQNPGDIIGFLSEFIPVSMAGETSNCPLGNTIITIFNQLAEWFGRKTRLSATVLATANKVDCALAMVSEEEVLDEVLGLGKITGSGEATIGNPVQKAGRTTGITSGIISQKNVTVNVNMGEGRIAVFEDQLLIQQPGFSAGGDSGSAILDSNMKIVGLLFAGSDQVTIANRYANVKEELKIIYP